MQREAGIAAERGGRLLDLAMTQGTEPRSWPGCGRTLAAIARAADGIARLQQLLDVAAGVGLPAGRIALDLSICRGLDITPAPSTRHF